ncbi:hypothetical protein [Flagellimonas sp.]|uniref:hypothetical protein n=1 Tax=Flagellimonas sp. TaxID=2058762 RepID=UPI003F49CD16
MKKWGEGMGMTNVESVVFDAQNNCLYVSNGENFAPGTKGYISKFNKNGELEQLKWVESLSRPTGMAIKNGQLWVADVNQLKVIDISSGKVIKKYPEPIENSGLNDVAINPRGEVYVTASFVHAVFKVEGDTLKLWLQDEKALQWANGIFATNQQVWVGGTLLSSINIETKEIREITSNPPIQDIDGLWPDGQDGYLISTVEGSSLWHLDAKGKSKLLHQGGDYLGDLQYVPEYASICIPRGNHKEKRYYLAVFELEGF